jgi:nitrogen fixation NifU-like protein
MKKAFDFLQDHSSRYLEMAFRTDRREALAQPDGYGKKTGVCRDTIEMFIKVVDNRIAFVSYTTNGCLNTNACANAVAELAEGRSPDEAWMISPEEVINYLETLPPDHYHCAELAVGTFYLALANYNELSKNPWKKHYLH